MIQVTQPFLPPKQEYDQTLHSIWERNIDELSSKEIYPRKYNGLPKSVIDRICEIIITTQN